MTQRWYKYQDKTGYVANVRLKTNWVKINHARAEASNPQDGNVQTIL